MLNLNFKGESKKCDAIVADDRDLREILNILNNINDRETPLNLSEIASNVFDIAASCAREMTPIQIQALANLGYVLTQSDKYTVSRSHLYEKVFLTFFKPV